MRDGTGLRSPLLIRPLERPTAEAQHFIELSDRYLAGLYPAESNHLEPLQALMRPQALFLGAYRDQTLIGCGAVKFMSDDGTYGEIKRVFVLEPYRRQGISRRIMQALEQQLLERGIRLARLETGIRQPEALALYRALGYWLRPPFGGYREDPLSLFMEKQLQPLR